MNKIFILIFLFISFSTFGHGNSIQSKILPHGFGVSHGEEFFLKNKNQEGFLFYCVNKFDCYLELIFRVEDHQNLLDFYNVKKDERFDSTKDYTLRCYYLSGNCVQSLVIDTYSNIVVEKHENNK